MSKHCQLCKDGYPQICINGALMHEALGFMWKCSVKDKLNDIIYTPQTAERDPLTRRDLLEHLMQECAEVIQAASKCLLYGWDRNWPGYGVNHEKLTAEVKDVIGILNGLGLTVGHESLMIAKLDKISKWKCYMRTHSEHGPQRGDK